MTIKGNKQILSGFRASIAPFRRDPLESFIAAIALLAAIFGVGLVEAGYRLGDLRIVAGLAILAALSERGRVKLGKNVESSVSLLPTLLTAVVFGPLAAMFVYGFSFVGELWVEGDRRFLKWSFYTSGRCITGGLAGLGAGEASRLSGNPIGSIAIGTLVAIITAEAVDVTLASVTFQLRGHGRMTAAVRSYAPAVLASVPLYAPVVAVLALAYQELSSWTLLLFFIPALAAQRVFILYQDQRRLTDDLVSVNTRLERANLSFATALVATLDARDRYTAGHSAAVAIYSRDVAARMGLSDSEQQLAHLCGLVHDIGKIGLPAGLLEKPGPMTLEERRLMERHAEIGERILAKVEDYAEIAAVVRHHHERVDGEGYPDRLGEEDIPLLSRIIGVADAYNAMTSDRPYRDAMPSRVARLRLAQAVESQFDTSVVAAFEAILAGAAEDYRTGRRWDFTLEAQDESVGVPAGELGAVAG